MSSSTSPLAYTDCYTALDKAVAEEFGARIPVPNENAAIYLRMRMHQARQIDRNRNKEIYKDQPDHPMYGRSEYDPLRLTVEHEGDQWYLMLAKFDAIEYVVEPLTALPATPGQRLLAPPNEEEEIEQGKEFELDGMTILPPAERIVRRKI